MTLTCSDCPSPITRKSKTGRCRQCSLAATNANPEIKARQRAATRRYASDPAVKAAASARLAAHRATISDARQRAHMAAATAIQSEAADARGSLPEAKAKAEVVPESFERQMARIAAGAQLVAAPDFRTSGPAYTLGGIASASL